MSFVTSVITVKSSDGIKQLPAIACREGVQLLANKDNTGIIGISSGIGSYTTVDNSYPLEKNKTIFLPCTSADQIFIKTSDATDQTLHILVI